ncbi:MAG: molybdate ABC transporter substrate-binding protein [Candidatus Humimicrobiaceae bacterium]
MVLVSITVMTGRNSNKKITLTISAASSLIDAIKEINDLYLKDKLNVAIIMNFNGSGTLQKQIENGAPVDIFISASTNQMDSLQENQLIMDDTRKNLLGNEIVMVVPYTGTPGLTGFMDLTKDNVQKIAIGDPKSVPAGMYAQQVFDKFAITERVAPKLVICFNVRQVLTYVESRNVDAGIVFFSDTKNNGGAGKIKIAAVGPEDVNAKIVYSVAVIKSTSELEAAKDYENFLFSDQAKMIFEKYGFSILGS